MVTLPDISLKDYNLETLPLVAKLRKQHFQASTEVCIERADLMTVWLKENAATKEDKQLVRAKAINHYLSNRSILFHDDNLLGGSTTSKAIGAPLYPEFMGLSIWPELETISNRDSNPQLLTKEESEKCNFDIFPYWMDNTVLEITRKKHNNPLSMQLLEKIIYYISGKAGCISHCVPSYQRVLEEGAEALIAEAAFKENQLSGKNNPSADDKRKTAFFKAVQVALQGIINYSQNISKEAKKLALSETDETKKENLERISEVCAQVPAKPARSFREAVNSLWICQVGLHAENINMALSPGRLDQVLYPFFKNDLENKEISIDEAITLGCCLFLKIADNTNLVPEAAEKLWGGAGSTPAVTLGGIDKEGNDAVNDLTYIFLRVTELMRLRDPSMNARYSYKANKIEYRQRVSEVIFNTKAIPAFHNDEADIKSLMNQGLSEEHARDYAIVGCVELAITGRDYVASGSIMFNLYAVMALTLFNGRISPTSTEQIGPETGDPTQFKNFKEFYAAFYKQLKWLLGQSIDINEKMGKVHQQEVSTPMLSAFFEGPMESGNDLIYGGATYNSSGASFLAFPDVCDSLNAIEKAVYSENKFSINDIIVAVKSNFKTNGSPNLLHEYLKNKTPKFGTDDIIALKNSKQLSKDIYDILQSHTNYRNGTYRPAYWTMTTHAGQGKLAGAMPNGRKSGEVFSSGITPASQAAQSLTEAYNSVAAIDYNNVPGGWALNIKYTPLASGENSSQYLKLFGDLVEGFFKNGGMQVQFNIQDYETLIDAKANPEKYPEMIVRVSGYSAYFKDLSNAMKDELITRTQYDLFSGKSVPLPSTFKQTAGV